MQPNFQSSLLHAQKRKALSLAFCRRCETRQNSLSALVTVVQSSRKDIARRTLSFGRSFRQK